jgi:branched-chain amino acid transport system ATP-binding protein
MLHVANIEASHGDSQVLYRVSFSVAPGEAVTLLDRNGMGKTITIRAVMGILPPRRSKILLYGAAIHRLPPYRVARLGSSLVPKGRQIFPNLTVRENLVATVANRGGATQPWTLDAVLALFAPLRERLHRAGALLSGSAQQMLAIGRALLTNPRLLILDEATEGLALLMHHEV